MVAAVVLHSANFELYLSSILSSILSKINLKLSSSTVTKQLQSLHTLCKSFLHISIEFVMLRHHIQWGSFKFISFYFVRCFQRFSNFIILSHFHQFSFIEHIKSDFIGMQQSCKQHNVWTFSLFGFYQILLRKKVFEFFFCEVFQAWNISIKLRQCT